MNIFLFWILVIAVLLTTYLYFIYRRSLKGYRFQVKLTIIFILLVLVPAIPLTSLVSGLLTQGVQMFLLPGIGESLSNSLEIIKRQLEEQGNYFINKYEKINQVTAPIAAQNKVAYYCSLKLDGDSLHVLETSGTNQQLFVNSQIYEAEIINLIKRNEIKSNIISVDNKHYCEFYHVDEKDTIRIVALEIDSSIISAKNKISESLRLYNSLSLIKKSFVEGQIIWGFATLFIILLALLAIYAANTLSRGISEPIQGLVCGMQRVAEGDLSHPVSVKAKDEIKFLVDSFNKMIAELKTSQEKLIQAERLAAWQEVARRISHEINNALTPIQISVRRLWSKFPTGETGEKDSSLKTISDEVDSLRRMAEEFSEFARMPQIKLAKEDLNDLIKNLTNFFASAPGAPQIQLDLDVNLSPLLIDRSQLRRALHNLIKNSLEASMEKNSPPKVVIETKKIDQSHRSAKIVIKDFGTGIEPEKLNKIFEPYYSTKKRGMGLGLSIVKRIVEDHGGEIYFFSQLGQGSRVEIYL